MKITATFNVTYKITDRDLFDEFEDEDSGAWVRFLTEVLDSVRYSEDWTKRLVSTEGDELWWDEDNDEGEAQVDVTIEIDFDEDMNWATSWLADIKDTWGIDLPEDPKFMLPTHYVNLVCTGSDEPWIPAGALRSIVRWGTTIPEQHPDGDGCFLEYSEDQELYLGKIFNVEDRLTFSSGSFTTASGVEYDFYGGDTWKEIYSSIDEEM